MLNVPTDRRRQYGTGTWQLTTFAAKAIMPWLVLSVLPNLDLSVVVAADQVAIVPAADPRVVALREGHPNLDQFLSRFHSSHGQAVHPAVVLFDTAAPDSKRTGEAMVGIRNALAVSVVTNQTAQALLYPHGHRILFTDPFDFYPWNLDRDFEHMISITPASMALHQVQDFSGQPSPGSPIHALSQFDVDQVLLEQILVHWNAAYRRPKMDDMQRALFRSLNMASAAMRMPATTAATIFDYGRQCGLWVSAFEILTNFEAGQANLGTVLALLEKKRFHIRGLNARRYRVQYRGQQTSVNLAQKLYERLYRVRNDFLHGNTVNARSLEIKSSGRFIGHFAPLLYRCALRNFLDLRFVPLVEPTNLEERIAAQFASQEYEEAQLDCEQALGRARTPVPVADVG